MRKRFGLWIKRLPKKHIVTVLTFQIGSTCLVIQRSWYRFSAKKKKQFFINVIKWLSCEGKKLTLSPKFCFSKYIIFLVLINLCWADPVCYKAHREQFLPGRFIDLGLDKYVCNHPILINLSISEANTFLGPDACCHFVLLLYNIKWSWLTYTCLDVIKVNRIHANYFQCSSMDSIVQNKTPNTFGLSVSR